MVCLHRMDFLKERPAEADAPPHINLYINVDKACAGADLWQWSACAGWTSLCKTGGEALFRQTLQGHMCVLVVSCTLTLAICK